MENAKIFCELNKPGIDFIRREFLVKSNSKKDNHETVEEALGNLQRPLRVLDIGCGMFPYLRPYKGIGGDGPILDFITPCELTLLSPHLFSKLEIIGQPVEDAVQVANEIKMAASKQVTDPVVPQFKNFLTTEKGNFQDLMGWDDDKGYDLIILSAVAHELFVDWCIRRISEDDSGNRDKIGQEAFFNELFGKLHVLLNQKGVLLFFENYTPKRINRVAQIKACERQLKILEHSDSPAVFVPTEYYWYKAEELGFKRLFQDSTRCIDMTVLRTWAKENGQKKDKDAEDAFIGRRFGVVLFQKLDKHNVRIKKRKNEEPRRGFVDDFAETANLKDVIKGLDGWAYGEWSDQVLLDHYKRTLCGEPDTRSDKYVFRWLTKKCYSVVDNDIRYNGSRRPDLFSNWVVFNSVIFGKRFVPTIRYSEGKDERDWPMIYQPGENDQPPSCVFSTAIPDWNALAYESFLSRDVFESIFGAANVGLEGIVRPSLSQYMSTHSGSDVGFRSLTLTYARLGADSVSPEIQRFLQEDAFNALDLHVLDPNDVSKFSDEDWEKTHALITFDFNGWREKLGAGGNCASLVTQVQKFNESVLGGAYFQDLNVGEGTCSYAACLTAMYFDFLFLRRYEQWAKSPSIDDWIEAFVKRWTDYLETPNNFILKHTNHVDLIRKIRNQLMVAQKGYAKIRENLMVDRLPSVLIAFPSPSTVSEKKPAPGTMLVLTDKIFPQAALQAMIAVAERTFYGLRNAELDAQSTNRFISLERANVRSAIGSIMSRNGSHNLGSHILASLAHEKGGRTADRAFYQYIQHRMDYLATASTDFPKWRLSMAFVGHVLKEFFEQPHLINYIARSEGLTGYRFSTDERQDGHIRFYIRRFPCAYYSDTDWSGKCSYPFGNGEKNFVVYSSSYSSEQLAVLSQDDLIVAIPGGVVGQHAFYTILENILRNAAKHELSALRKLSAVSKRECNSTTYSLALYIDFWDNPQKECVDCCIWTCAAVPKADGGLSFKARTSNELSRLCKEMEAKFKRSFMENNRLRREDWGIAEMRISAGYLWGSTLEQIGGPKSKEILEVIRPVVVDLNGGKAALGYRFRLRKPHELAVIFPDYLNPQNVDDYLMLFEKAKFIASQHGIRMVCQSDLFRNDFDSAYTFILFDNIDIDFDSDVKRFPFRILAKRCLIKNPIGIACPKSPDAFYRSVDDFVTTVAKGDDAAHEACQSLLADVYGAWIEYLNGLSEDNSSDTCVAIDIDKDDETASCNKNKEEQTLLDMLEFCFDLAVDEFLSTERNVYDESFARMLEKLRGHKNRSVDSPEGLVKRFPMRARYLKLTELFGLQFGAWCLDYLAMTQQDLGAVLGTEAFKKFREYVCGPFFARYKADFERQGEMESCLPPIFKHDVETIDQTAQFTVEIGRHCKENVDVWLLNYRPSLGSDEDVKFKSCLRYLRHENTSYDKNELYCEALSGSQSYLPQFASFCKCATGNEVLPFEEQRFLVSLIENARLRVAIVDERVFRYVKNHPETKNRLLGMGVSVRDDSDQALLAILTTRRVSPWTYPGTFDGVRATDFHVLILHQGIIDKYLPRGTTEKELLVYLNNIFPYVVITTGRGMPANIPDGARVLPYSVVEDTMLKAYPEKLVLIDAVMNLLPSNQKERENT